MGTAVCGPCPGLPSVWGDTGDRLRRPARETTDSDAAPDSGANAGATGPEREHAQRGELLRRWRAKAEFGENPDEARGRSAGQVEGRQG